MIGVDQRHNVVYFGDAMRQAKERKRTRTCEKPNQRATRQNQHRGYDGARLRRKQELTLLLEALVLGLIEIFFHDRIFELFRFVHHEGFVTPPRNDIVESLLFALVQNGVELQWKGRFNDLGWCWCGFVVTARRLCHGEKNNDNSSVRRFPTVARFTRFLSLLFYNSKKLLSSQDPKLAGREIFSEFTLFETK